MTDTVESTSSAASSSAGTRSLEHRTVSRIMSILEVVVASEPNGLRLADLSDMVGAPKSSIHGLARGLVATGYLREHRGRYYRGPAIAMLSLGGERIPAAYHHALETLRDDLGETAILATLAGDSVINIDMVESSHTIRASPPLHVRRPMWPGSYGKVFLAHMNPRRCDLYLNRKHPDADEQQRIRRELEEIRSRGVAFNRGESIPELHGIASPISYPGIDVTLAIGIAGPAHRIPEEMLEQIGDHIKKTADDLSTV